ncbi:hypothetical protein L861_15215 [Litchfieldella anticariensis FP35 = DSM 16096]|uniref:Uncharacterized protein n=1 Tax=Litchfieldella anticariensis (strain DSM 16096 / CECT 5854 / CIP 108499 / LMG 22089 / FP35) TaxID=1121939 RepID=S2L3U3_LITA3|nr:hypothetical protein L861_15215 [Halomonas anticariensis FP35 = DSM 16096]
MERCRVFSLAESLGGMENLIADLDQAWQTDSKVG